MIAVLSKSRGLQEHHAWDVIIKNDFRNNVKIF